MVMMVFSGFIATVLFGYSDLPPFVARVSVVLVGFASGAALGALIGWLKYKFNTNEVVVAIMMQLPSCSA